MAACATGTCAMPAAIARAARAAARRIAPPRRQPFVRVCCVAEGGRAIVGHDILAELDRLQSLNSRSGPHPAGHAAHNAAHQTDGRGFGGWPNGTIFKLARSAG